MTTQVTVRACCADEIEVEVAISSADGMVERHTLQNGESGEYYVYDDREIHVQEVTK